MMTNNLHDTNIHSDSGDLNEHLTVYLICMDT